MKIPPGNGSKSFCSRASSAPMEILVVEAMSRSSMFLASRASRRRAPTFAAGSREGPESVGMTFSVSPSICGSPLRLH